MNFILSVLFSVIEFSALVVVTLCIFRFNLTENLGRIALISLILAITSKILESFGIIDVSSISIQLMAFIILFRVLIAERWLNAILFTILGFFIFNVIEGGFLLLLKSYQLIGVKDFGGESNWKTYALQFFSSIIVFLISNLIVYLNQGFIFSVRKKKRDEKHSLSNLMLVTISLVSLIMLLSDMYMFFSNANSTFLIIGIVITVISSIILVLLYSNRDKKNFD